jgi:hypothetical protein
VGATSDDRIAAIPFLGLSSIFHVAAIEDGAHSGFVATTWAITFRFGRGAADCGGLRLPVLTIGENHSVLVHFTQFWSDETEVRASSRAKILRGLGAFYFTGGWNFESQRWTASFFW